ncbi:MAG: VaFE repeat-containing surface-anchored protein [Atopobiaceae bacterium]
MAKRRPADASHGCRARAPRAVLNAALATILVLYQLLCPLSAAAQDTSSPSEKPDEAASETTFTTERNMNNPTFSFTDAQGNVSYCLELEKHDPKTGEKYDYSHVATGAMGYITLHGYNNTTVIEGQELTADEARWATQYAYWMEQGCLDTDCRLLHESDQMRNPGRILQFITRDELGWKAGVRLYQAARAFEEDPARNVPTAPENRCALVYTKRGTDDLSQPMLVVRTHSGDIDLQKDSIDPKTIGSNDAYSLEGAWYSVWKDQECTQSTGTYLVTDADGKGRLLVWANGPTKDPAQLPEGTYYVRERRAPKGYQLDDNVYQVEVHEGQTSTLRPCGEASHEVPLEGTIWVRKSSGLAKLTQDNGAYSLAGAVFGVWSTQQDAQNQTDVALAKEDTDPLDGYWYLVHSGANDNYVLDADTGSDNVGLWRCSGADNQQWLFQKNPDGSYGLKNKAEGTTLTSQTGDGNAVTGDGGSWSVVQNDDGTISLRDASGRYLGVVGSDIHSGTNVAAGTDGSTVAQRWKLRSTSSFVGRIVTNQKGEGQLDHLPLGTYYVREVNAPAGYQLDGTVREVHVGSGSSGVLEVTDQPLGQPVDLVVSKYDADRGRLLRARSSSAQADASATDADQAGGQGLAGAQFTLRYYDGYYDDVADLPDSPTRSWVLRTDAQGRCSLVGAYKDPDTYLASGDPLYLDADHNPILPLGTVTIQETAAPVGYNLSDRQVYLQQIRGQQQSDGHFEATGFQPVEVGDTVIRGDLCIHKTDASTGLPLPGIAFLVTNKQTGERHVIVSDRSGVASTSAVPHSTGTNRNDLAVSFLDDGGVESVDQTKLSASNGVWFAWSNGVQARVTNERGALPYGTYEVSELPSTSNQHYVPAQPFEVTIGSEHALVQRSITNTPITLQTTLTGSGSDARSTAPKKSTRLTDEVRYQGLTPGKKYQLHATLMDKQTGEPLQVDGSTIEQTIEVVPKASTGSVQVTFDLDATSLAGHTVVAFENLMRDGKEVAAHADLNDADQTVWFACIGTTATDSATKDHVATGTGNDILVDTVAYSGLQPGSVYSLVATLHLRGADGRDLGPAKASDGSIITATKEFTPTDSNGTVDVSVTADTSAFAGQTLVFFESLQQAGHEVSSHTDIADDDQAINVPSLETNATCAGSHTAAPQGATKIVDQVSYANLIPGRSYTLSGTLVDASTGQTISVDGHKLTASAQLKPDNPDGCATVSFDISDASRLRGMTAVAFERLTLGDVEVARHEDAHDEQQTVRFCSIGTSARDQSDGDHVLSAEGSSTIVDTVTHQNLIPGKEYALNARLMDATTGQAILHNGAEVTSSVSFTPTEPNGTQDVQIALEPSEWVGKKLVVFEKLSLDGTVVATHEDIDDAEQAVYVPSVRTTLVDSADGDHDIDASNDIHLVDTVAYSGLQPGIEYHVLGSLMHRNDGSPVTRSDGTPVTAEATFIPSEESGQVEVAFQLDASDLAGTDVVAFEDLQTNGATVASHRDLQDRDQTVHVGGTTPNSPVPTTPEHPAGKLTSSSPSAKLPSTGDRGMDALIGACMLGTLACFASAFVLVRPRIHPRR